MGRQNAKSREFPFHRQLLGVLVFALFFSTVDGRAGPPDCLVEYGELGKSRTGANSGSKVGERLQALGLSVAEGEGDSAGVLRLAGLDAQALARLPPEQAEALRALQRLRESQGLNFLLARDLEGLPAQTVFNDLRSAGNGIGIRLGRDFLDNPSAIAAQLKKTESLLSASRPQSLLTGLESRADFLDLASGKVRWEIRGTEEASSGPALWIRNRNARHGVRVFVDDSQFKPGSDFLAFSRGADVFMSSRALRNTAEEKVKLTLAHELHHATLTAMCLKGSPANGFAGCEQKIAFFAEKGGGILGFFQRKKAISEFSGYKDFFSSDELEAYKISGNPKHAEAMAVDQLPWLRQLRQEIAAGKHDLMQANPMLHIEMPEGLHLKIGLPVDHVFATDAEARSFYTQFLDKRINGIEVIRKEVDHATALGQPHRTILRKYWDRLFQEG